MHGTGHERGKAGADVGTAHNPGGATQPVGDADVLDTGPAAGGRRLRRFLVPLLVWCIPAAVLMKVVLLSSDATLWQAFIGVGLPMLLWALFTPGILALTRRFPIDRAPRARSILAHIGAALLVGCFVGAVVAVVSIVLGFTEETQLTIAQHAAAEIRFWTLIGVFFYGATASVGFAIDYHRKLRERETTAARLEAQLVEARLSALRMQLEPHFLFNALNTVSMLVRQGDDTAAVRVVARLSDLLRHVLDESAEPIVPLRTEIDFVTRYLEIEQLRFRDRLDVRIDVDDDVADASVPALLLQPLVENAIRHGIAARAAAGLISLDAHAQDGHLVIRICDDGPGFTPDWESAGAGIGLRNTRDRLRYLYGDLARLDIENGNQSGATITVTLPLSAPRQPRYRHAD